MNSNSKLQSNTEAIYQSIEELHTLLSGLEQQIRSGLRSTQPETDTVESVISEERSPLQEDRSSL